MSSSNVPIPGNLVPKRSEQEQWLKRCVSAMCGRDDEKFPGSQPVSFGVKDLDRLQHEDYWLCEKSDGVRVLLLVFTNLETRAQSVYLIDRKNDYREIYGLYFPHHTNPVDPLRNTLVDAELVLDVDPKTKQETLRLLCFDCLVIDGDNILSKPLDKRYGRLNDWFYKPYAKMLVDHPQMAQAQPFSVKVKQMRLSYHAEEVFKTDIPALHHGNDGLIFTPATTPYVVGTDTKTLKWKPPSENSVDFKLVLRFPPLPNNPSEPDLQAKPIFALHVWCGERSYELYDVMHVEDDEWDKLKQSGEQVDDRIVEVHWDMTGSCWRMMRFRDDKDHGNHRSVVQNILESIADGVDKDTLLSQAMVIRNSWKTRHGEPIGPSQPPIRGANAPPPSRPPFQPPRPMPPSERRYGPLAPSRYSKVAGPSTIAGMHR